MQIFNYAFNLGGDFSVKMEGMSDAMGEFNANIRATQQGIGKMTQALATFNITKDFFSNISEAFVGITEAGASAELQMMNLKTLFGGNAEAANDMYERISEYGKVTPYDKAGLLEAQRTMMSFGMSGESAFSTLQQIGDIAMGDSQKLQSLALAFGQVSSTGKLTGQDLMQMINAGFNPLNEISKATGKSVSELKEDMSKGAISVEMVSEAFRRATSEGGLFHGAIEAASETASGKLASIRDSIEEIKVSIFNATGEFGLWATMFGELMVPLSQLMPVIMGIGKAMQWVNGLQWAAMWSSVTTRIKTAIVGLVMYNQTMKAGIVVSGGFRTNILQATIAVVRFATVGILQALKGLGAFVLSLVTGGTASATFAGIASTSFATFKTAAVTACRAVGIAIKNIPIIGWIAAAVSALIALGVYFWNTSVKFRAILKGLGAAFLQTFKGIWECAVDVFSAIGDLLKHVFTLEWGSIDDDIAKMTNTFKDYGKSIGDSFAKAYKAEMAKGEKNVKDEQAKEQIVPDIPSLGPTPNISSPTGTTLSRVGDSAASSGGTIRNITISVEKLVEKFEIHTTNLQGDVTKAKEMIVETLLSALNDVNLAL